MVGPVPPTQLIDFVSHRFAGADAPPLRFLMVRSPDLT